MWHRIDYDGLWSSSKLAQCSDDAQADYPWIYGVADAHGCFEITNPQVLLGRVGAIRKKLTPKRFRKDLNEYRANGLLFQWGQGRKQFGYWTGCEERLPRPSIRARYKRSTPPVPHDRLAEYLRNFDCEAGVQRSQNSKPRRDFVMMESRPYHDNDDGNDNGNGTKDGASGIDAPKAHAAEQRSPFAFTGLHIAVKFRQDRVLSDAFPWVDRLAEYRKADSWCEANPSRRPKKNSSGFLHNWFARIPALNPIISADRNAETRKEIETGRGPELGVARVKLAALERAKSRSALVTTGGLNAR